MARADSTSGMSSMCRASAILRISSACFFVLSSSLRIPLQRPAAFSGAAASGCTASASGAAPVVALAEIFQAPNTSVGPASMLAL